LTPLLLKKTQNVRFAVIEKHAPLRLRPSVSVIPTSDQHVWEFFQSNTRRIKHIKFADPNLAKVVCSLNGESLSDIKIHHKNSEKTIDELFNALMDWCFIEYTQVGVEIENSKFFRVLNFLADYIPSYDLIPSFGNIASSKVLIFGVGGVGSWIALGLAQSGVQNFILCDPDIVKLHNLNRSLFKYDDIGKRKTEVTHEKIKNLGNNCHVVEINKTVKTTKEAIEILSSDMEISLVINAADYPNVDTTSQIIFSSCMKMGIPHIVSGGYNLH
jgi:hypothetical protein